MHTNLKCFIIVNVINYYIIALLFFITNFNHDFTFSDWGYESPIGKQKINISYGATVGRVVFDKNTTATKNNYFEPVIKLLICSIVQKSFAIVSMR